MKDRICIYHGDCADGFTAAWAVHQALGDKDTQYLAARYNEPLPTNLKDKEVILVDFSYKRDAMISIMHEAQSVTVLDHHKTAQQELDGLQAMFPGKSDVIFDMTKSGAMLAWEYFHTSPAPALVRYVQDRDLWQHQLAKTKEINEYIFSYPYQFLMWTALAEALEERGGIDRAIQQGEGILRKKQRDVEELVKLMKRLMVIGGTLVPVANIPHILTSEAGHLMSQGQPFAACYWDTPAGRVFSLRSQPAGADVSKIARSYGGGGHPNAAGFTAPRGWEGDPC